MGSHWASCLGAALREIRPLFPPATDASFRAWDPGPLLRQLKLAVPPHYNRPAARETTACGLADAGRIAAAKAALKGGSPQERPQPSGELRDALERLHPEPDERAPAISQQEFDEAADHLSDAIHALPATRRITPETLHHSALRTRGSSAPGPDGWTGDMVRRAARLFRQTTTDLLWRYFLALRDTKDALLAHALLDAVMLAFRKPGASADAPGRFRPISIAGAFARCILAKAVTLSRKRLRDILDPMGQFALTGTPRPVADLMAAVATCSRAQTPYVLSRADIVNAFGTAGQGALLHAIRRIGGAAPELAALSLRAQCSTREGGDVELLLRGTYPEEAGSSRLSVRRYARGGAQGPPDMPAAFAMVMAEVDEEAARRAGDGPRECITPASPKEAAEELWALFRQVSPALPDEPEEAWAEALGDLYRARAPTATSVSAIYADDAHSAGDFYTAIRRTLWRVVCGRESGLMESPHKCGLLTAPRWRDRMEVIIAPLRHGDPAAWPLMESMRILGVTFADPEDADAARARVIESLVSTVVEPTRRLEAEVRSGERKGTALFMLHRYILPVLAYHQGAWGLLVDPAAWQGVDEALASFCEAVCPDELQGRLRGPLRRELALPKGEGGLGIPRAAEEAPLRAAALWPRDRATAAGARPGLTAAAYKEVPGPLGLRTSKPITPAEHHRQAAAREREASTGTERRRLEQNAMRCGTRAFEAVPWRPELSIDNTEFDVAWRLAFGGLTPQMVNLIDHPTNGFRWRGERAEWAFAQALHDCLPPGSVVTGEKPAPELEPPGEAALAQGECADVDVLTRSGRRFVFDIRTVNVQCASGARTTSEAQCAAIEREKIRHYGRHYRQFAPFVTTLSGAVTQASAGALMKVVKETQQGDGSVLDWEPSRWCENILHRMAIESIKTVAIIATRAVLPPRSHIQHRVFASRRVDECRVSRETGRVAPRASRPGPRDAARCVSCHKS